MNSSAKTSVLTFLIVLFGAGVTPASAQLIQPNRDRLDEKIEKAMERLDDIQRNPETRISPSVLEDALGIIIIQQFKAGIGIGAQGGGGVALVRDRRNGHWSPPAFVANAEGSYGWQIGAQNANTVFCIMHEEGMKILREGGVKFGLDVRATAGPRSAGGEAAVANVQSPILVYSDREGLFAGVAIEGGGILPAQKKNVAYYGLSMQEVLFTPKAKLSQTGADLIRKIIAYSSSTPSPRLGPGSKPGAQEASPRSQPEVFSPHPRDFRIR